MKRAESQGEWVIVLLLSIRLQNFTKVLKPIIFYAALSLILLQCLKGGVMSPL